MKFSIITIALNAREALKQTIDSVNAQTFADCEHVIVDGGSNDGSQEMFLEQSKRLGAWVSEKDAGISSAFNHGTRLAQGEWVCYLNAGDIFAATDVLEKVAAGIAATELGDAVYYGNFICETPDERNLASASADPEKFAWSNPINHQSVFLPRTLALQQPYDEALPLGMDYDLWLRLLKVVPFRKLDTVIAIFRTDGRSSDPKWAIHNLVVRRFLWHKSRRERIDWRALSSLYWHGIKLQAGLLGRRLLGKKAVALLKKLGLRRKRFKPLPAHMEVSNA